MIAVLSRRVLVRSMLSTRTLGRPLSVGTESVLIADPPRMRVIDLHRPKALNALNAEMVETLLPLVQNWQQIDGDVKLVVFRGAGDRAFCAGGDIRFLRDCASTGTADGRKPALDFFAQEYALNHAIGTSRIPVVSILDGIVMGGGVGLSVHGQFRIATENTTFAMPGATQLLRPDASTSRLAPGASRLAPRASHFLDRDPVCSRPSNSIVPTALPLALWCRDRHRLLS